MITFTIDLEDPTEHYTTQGRYITMTRRILDMCDVLQRQATFFIVGRVAEAAPELIRDIAAKGHEIAYHSHAHVPLTAEDPERFRKETAQDKDVLEQLTGQQVIGFRAPQFSLTPRTLWVIDSLDDLGFRYSSSIMPTKMSRFGFPGAPRTPFVWSNGLIELPLPTATVGTLSLPYLGGIYLYTLPSFLARFWAHHADPDTLLWTYTHPYDFDREDKFARMAHTPYWISFILSLSRFVADQKIMRLLKDNNAPPLRERLPSPRALPKIKL